VVWTSFTTLADSPQPSLIEHWFLFIYPHLN
jgi:hypothetical protein